MLSIMIISFDTGEILGDVTTRYNSYEILFENVQMWMRRHKGYTYVDAEELKERGIEWDKGEYWVKEVQEG